MAISVWCKSASTTPSRTPAPTPSTPSTSPTPSPSTTEADDRVVITPSQYRGRPEAEVAAELGALGFRVEIQRQFSADVAAGLVTDVAPVGSLSPGETITVTSSRGPEPVEQVTVPANLQGRTAAEVEQILVDLGLRPLNVGSEPSQQPEGTVIRVDPGAGPVAPADGDPVPAPSGPESS